MWSCDGDRRGITGGARPSAAKPRFGGGAQQWASWRFQGRSLGSTSAFRVAQAGMVRTFQLTKSLAAMTVLDNMLLGAQQQPGERLSAALFRPAWHPLPACLSRRRASLGQCLTGAFLRWAVSSWRWSSGGR